MDDSGQSRPKRRRRGSLSRAVDSEAAHESPKTIAQPEFVETDVERSETRYGIFDNGNYGKRVLDAIESENAEQFLTLFDCQRIDCIEFSKDQRVLICQWMDRCMCEPVAVGLGTYLLGDFECIEKYARYYVRWKWPKPQYSDECILAVHDDSMSVDSHPDSLLKDFGAGKDKGIFVRRCVRQSEIERGMPTLLRTDRDWSGRRVSVWAIVNSRLYMSERSGRRFCTRPLFLDPLPTH